MNTPEVERAARAATEALAKFDRAGVTTVLQTVPYLTQTLRELLAAVTATNKPADEPRVLSIVAEIVSERGRQDAKWGAPHDVPDGTGSGKRMLGRAFADIRDEVQAWVDRAAEEGTSTMSTVLLEEVFEALAESDEQKLRAELIQVAAVAAKWIQIIDERDTLS